MYVLNCPHLPLHRYLNVCRRLTPWCQTEYRHSSIGVEATREHEDIHAIISSVSQNLQEKIKLRNQDNVCHKLPISHTSLPQHAQDVSDILSMLQHFQVHISMRLLYYLILVD